MHPKVIGRILCPIVYEFNWLSDVSFFVLINLDLFSLNEEMPFYIGYLYFSITNFNETRRQSLRLINKCLAIDYWEAIVEYFVPQYPNFISEMAFNQLVETNTPTVQDLDKWIKQRSLII